MARGKTLKTIIMLLIAAILVGASFVFVDSTVLVIRQDGLGHNNSLCLMGISLIALIFDFLFFVALLRSQQERFTSRVWLYCSAAFIILSAALIVCFKQAEQYELPWLLISITGLGLVISSVGALIALAYRKSYQDMVLHHHH